MMMAMTVIVVVMVLVMSVGVTMSMIVIMIFPAPIPFPVMPPVRSVLVVRAGPICAGIGGSLIMPRDPAIVLALRLPEAAYPDECGFGRRRRRSLITDGRRSYPDIDGDLRPGWRRESCCNNSESHTVFQHVALSLMNSKINLKTTRTSVCI
jgi:hypothetical protein